jgi:hypothetical protein
LKNFLDLFMLRLTERFMLEKQFKIYLEQILKIDLL